jgi:hypothetical protein
MKKHQLAKEIVLLLSPGLLDLGGVKGEQRSVYVPSNKVIGIVGIKFNFNNIVIHRFTQLSRHLPTGI